jgi:hypothetical protein
MMVKSKRKARRRRWTAEEIEYLRRNFSKKNISEIAKELGRTVSGVRAAVYALRLKKAKQDVRSKE